MEIETKPDKPDKFSEILHIQWIKDNLSIITIVPLILGGIWQIISLSAMSISYVRFFSVTQQLSDGLLILLSFAIIYITFSLISKFMMIKSIYDFDFQDKSYKALILLLLLNVFICYMFFMTFRVFLYRLYIDKDLDLPKLAILIVAIIAISMPLIRILINAYLLLIKITGLKKMALKSETQTRIIKILLLAILFSIYKFIPDITVKFHKKYIVPNNLINTKNIINNYLSEQKNPSKDSVQIIYFNDKFIFIQNKQDIEILKFDDLFEVKKK